MSPGCCAHSSSSRRSRRRPIAAPVVEQDAIPGLPAVQVQDLHYGDVLFHFYQQDYFDSLVRLAAYRDQGRLVAHARDAELLRGGLYLSLGQHREAREIFERLLADTSTPQPVRDQAWFYLGKVLYAAGLYEESDRALRQSAGTLSDDVEAERHLLIAQGLLYRQRYDQAIAELSNWAGAALLAALRAVQPRRRAGARGGGAARPRNARQRRADRDAVA